MTLTEALKQGYEVKIKLGEVWLDENINTAALIVTVVKTDKKSIAYVPAQEEFLEDVPSMNCLIDKLIYDAVKNYESNSLP